MKVGPVLESCLCVDDLDAAARFYTEVLGLELVAREPGRHVFFRCGTSMVLLFNPVATAAPTRVNGPLMLPHGTTGAGHLAFRATAEELSAWREHFAAMGVRIESEIEWPEAGRSLYFRDPAGNLLELAPPKLWGLS